MFIILNIILIENSLCRNETSVMYIHVQIVSYRPYNMFQLLSFKLNLKGFDSEKVSFYQLMSLHT